MQEFGNLCQRSQRLAKEAFLGNDSRVVLKQLLVGLEISRLQLQHLNIAMLFGERCEVYLTVVRQFLVFFALRFQGFGEHNVGTHILTDIHNATPLTVNLFAVIIANRLLRLLLLTIAFGCQ